MNIPDQRLQLFEYTGKKATLFEYTGKKATLFEYTRKRLHFLNIQEIGYIF